MQTPLFTGACTAVITPFRDGKSDLEAFSRLVEAQHEGGVSALVVCGTTGEAATLSPDERSALVRLAAKQSAGRMKIIAGIGSNDTGKALDAAIRAADDGADGVLMVTPYYNKTTQAGLIRHFTHVADRSSLPVILYNVPSRTGIGITPETYAALADHPGICGVKEASGNLSGFARTISLCGDRLTFWSGNDSDTVAMMALGAKGVISVASNLVPDVVTRLCALCLQGDYTEAAALNAEYMALFDILFRQVNPIPVKTAMGLLGKCEPEFRLPLVPMSEADRRILRGCLVRYKLLETSH